MAGSSSLYDSDQNENSIYMEDSVIEEHIFPESCSRSETENYEGPSGK